MSAAPSIRQHSEPTHMKKASQAVFHSDEPLWRRVPSRDENGHLLADFRMLIPGLRDKSGLRQQHTLRIINAVLKHYDSWVVFADMNLRTNLLWVSIRPRPGLTLEIPAAIKTLVPEALLLAPYWRSA